VQILAGVFSFLVIMGLGNTFFNLGGSSKVPLIATAVVGAIAGGAGGYFSGRFVKAYGTILICGLVGVSLGFMITSAFTMHVAIKYVIIIVCALVAGYFGVKLGELIEMLGTAVIGSAMLTHGAGAYIGGFPSMADAKFHNLKSNWGYIGYLVAWIVLAVAGYFVQKQFFPRNKKDVMQHDEPAEGGSKDKYYGQ